MVIDSECEKHGALSTFSSGKLRPIQSNRSCVSWLT